MSFSDDENAGSYIDTLLVMLWFLPVTLAVVLESPLKSVVSALLSWPATKRMTTLPVESGTTEDSSTVRHGDINLASAGPSTGEDLQMPASQVYNSQKRFLAKEEAQEPNQVDDSQR